MMKPVKEQLKIEPTSVGMSNSTIFPLSEVEGSILVNRANTTEVFYFSESTRCEQNNMCGYTK